MLLAHVSRSGVSRLPFSNGCPHQDSQILQMQLVLDIPCIVYIIRTPLHSMKLTSPDELHATILTINFEGAVSVFFRHQRPATFPSVLTCSHLACYFMRRLALQACADRYVTDFRAWLIHAANTLQVTPGRKTACRSAYTLSSVHPTVRYVWQDTRTSRV